MTAINAAGAGKPSDTSHIITAKPMREAPKLYLDALIGRRIKVRAGEPINVVIPITGAPTPKIEWTKNLIRVVDTLRISVSRTFPTSLYANIIEKKNKNV